MTSRDRWVTVEPTGVIKVNSENDGWTFLRSGADREEEIGTLDQLSGSLLQQAIFGLRYHGLPVPNDVVVRRT